MEKKQLWTTYILWFLLGWSGMHHFYLGRDAQAFVWWSTCGGFFYIGWIRDFWRIPEYVDEANEEISTLENPKVRTKFKRKPPFNSTRFSGEIFVGCFYGLLVRLALPDFIIESFTITCLLVSFGVAIGVYLVGNIGKEGGPFAKCYLTSISVYTLLAMIAADEPSLMYCSIFASITFNYYRTYKPHKKIGLWMRSIRLSLGASVITLLWASFFYFNATITLQNGETIHLRESINHFSKSPAWLDFKNTMWTLYDQTDNKTWRDQWEEVIESLDPTGEKNAYKTLDIPASATEDDVKQAYKKLVMKWHPDRYKGPDLDTAQKRFLEVQEAYELLNKYKKKTLDGPRKRTEF